MNSPTELNKQEIAMRFDIDKPRSREEKIKMFGLDIVEDEEREWETRGYRVNYETGLLEKLA